jgi:hypothetical protein
MPAIDFIIVFPLTPPLTVEDGLGYDRETVARVLQEGVPRPPLRRVRASHVDPYRGQIAQWIREGLTGVRMLELARSDPQRPYRGGHSVFRAAVRRARLAQAHEDAVADVPVRFEGLPANPGMDAARPQASHGRSRRSAGAENHGLGCRIRERHRTPL